MLFTCCNGWAAVGVTEPTQEPATTCPPDITRPAGIGEPTLVAASVRDHRFLPVPGSVSVIRPPLVGYAPPPMDVSTAPTAQSSPSARPPTASENGSAPVDGSLTTVAPSL